ncbi:unnamed protein product [Protopolystoma xenopodis]|uniref:Uncharacterized protein n=1 Tax=Protopolystoma xenopodis TaxID=117903 RepID=A0A3S5B0D2_9PLAT|nr:unnamed protein product [Protopolystoma xenopodis]
MGVSISHDLEERRGLMETLLVILYLAMLCDRYHARRTSPTISKKESQDYNGSEALDFPALHRCSSPKMSSFGKENVSESKCVHPSASSRILDPPPPAPYVSLGWLVYLKDDKYADGHSQANVRRPMKDMVEKLQGKRPHLILTDEASLKGLIQVSRVAYFYL